jgi:hypothetical protein
MTPRFVVETRQAVCRDSCTEHCAAYSAGTLDHSDSHAACPRREWILAWGCYGPCAGPSPAFTDRPPLIPAEPTVIDLATRAAYAAWRAAAAALHGERVLVTEDEYAARSVACESCPHWDGAARAGLGKCKAPNCGCTKLKRWLATETCPLRKWPPLSAAG